MKKCIYCQKGNNQVSFSGKEHVIPKFLGRFTPLNPTLKQCVCDKCNSEIFSELETRFSEDSYEGLHGQMLNLHGRNSVRVRNKNCQLKFTNDLGDEFFDKIFPFLKLDEECNRFTITLKPQIRIDNPENNSFQIFLIESLARMKEKSKEFQKFEERLKKLNKKNISIFAPSEKLSEPTIEKAIKILNDFGVPYNEKNRKLALNKGKDMEFRFEGNCTISEDIERVFVKIAFNYFVYCVIQEGKQEILLSSNFDKIKNFIMGKDSSKRREILISVDKDYILWEEKIRKKRAAAHMIVFEIKDGKIIAKETFFGLRIYEIVIGEVPREFDKKSFGCGHLFNPFTKQIHQLSGLPVDKSSEEQIRLSFGLFKKHL